jgi:glycosyltransferase involved in cell wall biosynthesis
MGATSGPLKLSVAIVCRDNEATIGRTLESVERLLGHSVAGGIGGGEIVAVDSGSTDGTIGLLEKHGARVIPSAWLGYVKTKQLALESCRAEWVLCLDSDESVEPDLAESIRAAVAPSPAPGGGGGRVVEAGGGRNGPGSVSCIGGYELNRKVYYRGRALNHAWQPEWRLRLVRREGARWTGLDPHDSLQPASGSRIERLAGTLRHDSIGTFAEFFAKQARHGALMARSLHETGKRGSYARLVLSPVGAVLKQLLLKSAWRDGYPGWLAAAATGVGAAVKHGVLLEMGKGERGVWQGRMQNRE